jgi:hypothetical protein
MGILEDITLRDSIEIRATPEMVFGFLSSLVDDRSYRVWHPDDHVALRWLKGEPWKQGSVAYAEEYVHGKLHKIKFLVTKVIPNRQIEYVPLSRILRTYFPGNGFTIEPKGESCVFTATVSLRVGWLVKKLFKGKVETGLSGVRKHIREEGENLKKLLEEEGSPRNDGPDVGCTS